MFSILLRAPAVRRVGRGVVGVYRRLWLLVLASLALQWLLVSIGPLREIFQLGVPQAWQWGVALGLGAVPAVVERVIGRRDDDDDDE